MTNATGWNDGYEADIAYDTSYYRELSPGWLVTTAMLAGVRPPRIDRAFRWAELGCGTGLTGAACAAATPHGEFWGFDFNPVHITKAINLADRAAIPNAIYQERSFAELASLADAALPAFDFVVVHGVYSWLTRENQAHLQDFIRRRLRPGGLACIGYNVATGWAPITPVGYLLRLLTEGHPAARGDVGAAIGLLEKLRDGGAEYLKRNPAAAAAVGSLSRSSRAYVTHHYMAENWRPQMFPQVADDMVRARCAYIASANLTDNFPVTSVPGALIPMLNEAAEPRLREAVRDFASARGFRRDLFGRGPEPLHPSEQRSLLCDTLFAGLGTRPEGAVPIPCSLGVAQGPADLYQPLLAALEKEAMPWDQALAASPLSARRFTESIEAIGMLMAAGYIHPAWPAASAAAGRLNAEIARLSRAGEVLNCLSAPALGAGLVAEAAEVLAYGALLDGVPADVPSLALALKAALRQSGRSIAPASSGAAPAASAETAPEPEAGLARSLLASRLPTLQHLCAGGTLDQS